MGSQKGRIKTVFRNTVTIDGQQIGIDQPVYVIAEIGRSFNDITTAKKLIKEAAKAEADAVKIQSIDADALLIKNDFTKDHYNTLKNLELTLEEHKHLKDFADTCGITFLSTPESLSMVKLLESIKIPAYKIASLDLTYNSLLRQIAITQKPIILSTGMATITEIQAALDVINHAGNNQVILLYCTSLYPTNLEDLDLKSIQTFSNLGVIPGFSDHTIGTLATLTAVALGAKVIEKHFTLDSQQGGIDHKIALEPKQLHTLIKEIDQISSMLFGGGYKRMSTKEWSTRLIKRRKLVAAEDIKKDTQLYYPMLNFLQTDTIKGILSHMGDYIIGKTLRRDVTKGQLITWELIKW